MPVKDAYRRRFLDAYFWFDVMQVKLDERRRHVLQEFRQRATNIVDGVDDADASADLRQPTWDAAGSSAASQFLQDACPACFASNAWGHALHE